LGKKSLFWIFRVPLILPCAWVILYPHLRLVFSCPRGSPIQLGFLQTESVCLWRGVESRSCSSALPFLFVRDTIALRDFHFLVFSSTTAGLSIARVFRLAARGSPWFKTGSLVSLGQVSRTASQRVYSFPLGLRTGVAGHRFPS
jgi:hypothetical protein